MIENVNPTVVLNLSVPLASAVLGLLIGYQAYRGFLRHDNASMQFLSIGLILLTAVSISVAAFGTLLIRWEILSVAFENTIRLVSRVSQFAGLAFITYSLYRRP